MKNHKIQIVFILVLVSFFNTYLSFADLSEGKTKLKFTEHGPFYGVKEDGKRIRGILLDPNREGDRSDWYGLFTNSDFYWKGYFKHTYEDGRILYQYNEYKIDKKGNVIQDDQGKFLLVDSYLISKEDFEKVKKYINYDIPIPFSFYEFGDKKLTENVDINYKEINFPDKKYLGQLNYNGEPHGKGTMIWTLEKFKDHKYVGDWKNGNRDGNGVYTKPNGDKYNGQYKNDKPHGYGVFEWADGVKYEGYHKDGLQHGWGKYYFLNGNFFEGEWIKDTMNYGKMIYAKQGVTYEGYWKDTKWHGIGVYNFKNGDVFEGHFNMGELDHGEYKYKIGDKFIGKYKNGSRYYGTHYYKNGDTYKGYWSGKGRRNGKGVQTYVNGDIYDGEWLNGKKNGQGIYKFKAGHSLQGEWINGFLYEGVATYDGGHLYTGQFKNGKKHGLGTFIFSDGRKLEGRFENNEFIEEKKIAKKSTSQEVFQTNERYYALVIGNNNYEHLEKLDAAENDAAVIADVLENKYGFKVDLLLNADYETTVDFLFNITNKLKKDDNLLIYYAGHGEIDKAEDRGYWLPVDASYEKRSKWISNQRIVDRIKATKAKHVLLIADSCFSGTLMRSGSLPNEIDNINEKYIERLKKKKTRLVITSGGNEPVVDSVGGDHSLFALKLIETLRDNNNVINSQILFENIRRYVVANADQTPERAMVHKTGHDGGDFLFFPK